MEYLSYYSHINNKNTRMRKAKLVDTGCHCMIKLIVHELALHSTFVAWSGRGISQSIIDEIWNVS